MSLKELAREYKASAARIKKRIDELSKHKDPDMRRKEYLWTEYRDLLKIAENWITTMTKIEEGRSLNKFE